MHLESERRGVGNTCGAFQWRLESVLLTACSRGPHRESLFQGQCYGVLHGSCPVLFLPEASRPRPGPWCFSVAPPQAHVEGSSPFVGEGTAGPPPPPARLPGSGAGGLVLGSEHPTAEFRKTRRVPGDSGSLLRDPSCFGGWSCAWTRSSLAISSISLWQNKCLYITFKGGFCLKNLSEQTCWGHAGEGVSEWAPLAPLAWTCSGRRGS